MQFFALLFALLFFSACQNRQPPFTHKIPTACEYYSLKAAQCLNEEQMLKKIEPYSVIFIGDHHAEPELHKKIASLIASLSKTGFKIHLANEWFNPSDDKTLHAFTDNTIDEKEFLEQIAWNKRLKYYDYDSFKPIYEAVKQYQGRLYGINLSKKQKKKISDQNLLFMSTQEQQFNQDLDLEVNPHKELVMPYLNHCHAPKKDESLKECIQRMYRVQVAWDTKMALESYRLAQGLKQDEKLLVFAGSMHIQDHLGIPLRFARLSNLPTLSIVPVDHRTDEADNGFGDYLLFYQEKASSK